MLVTRAGDSLRLDFESTGMARYEVFEGAIGDWYSHSGAGCRADGASSGRGIELTHAPAAGSRYFLVAADSPCGGLLGSATDGIVRPGRTTSCQ